MADSVMIMGTGPDSARLAAAIYLLQNLPAAGETVAYYKPVISPAVTNNGHGGTRAAIHLFAPQALTGNYYTACMESPGIGRKETIDAIACNYDKLSRLNGRVVMEGTDYLPATGAFEGDLNLDIAQHCGTPVLLMLKAEGKLPAALAVEARDVAERLASRKIPLIGIIVHGVNAPPSAVTGLLRAVLGDKIYCVALEDLGVPNYLLSANGHDLSRSRITTAIGDAIDMLAKGVNISVIKENLDQVPQSLTGSLFRSRLLQAVKGYKSRIVLPEGEDTRTLRAAARFTALCSGKLILMGNPEKIQSALQKEQLTLKWENVTIIDPAANPEGEDFAGLLYELRKEKGMTITKARALTLEPCWQGCLMMKRNLADAMVSGAVYTTPQTVRPALQLIKARKGKSLVSSVFFMCLPQQVFIFADCAVNPDPSAEQLAEIALSSAETSRKFGIEPRVAMISYSTAESGAGTTVEKVRRATSIVKQRAPALLIEGPMQYDAAVDPVTAHAKWPGSAVAGRATVFIFPDLNTGNTVYKAVQQATGAIAIGPVLQELDKPVNDLSRGGTADDIFYTLLAAMLQCRDHSGNRYRKIIK